MTNLTMHTASGLLERAATRVDFDADKHRYYRAGTRTRVPGVTTILGVLNKPALVGWASRCAVEYIRHELATNPDAIMDHVLDAAVGAHARIAKDGADIGSAAHDAINVWASGLPWETYLPEDPNARLATQAMLQWMSDRGVRVLASEVIVVDQHDPVRWAGTVDLVCDVPGVGLVVADMKTNRSSSTTGGVYPEQVLQCGAYAQCVEAALGEPVMQTVVVHACREGTGWLPVERNRSEWLADAEIFGHCVDTYEALKTLRKAVTTAVKAGRQGGSVEQETAA